MARLNVSSRILVMASSKGVVYLLVKYQV